MRSMRCSSGCGWPSRARKARPERFDDLITLSIHLLRGMALQRILRPDEAERQRLFQVWKAMARRELGA